MATIGDIDSLALRDLLESLPQELYDYIYKFTFTAQRKVHVYTKSKAQIDVTLATLVRKLGSPVINLNEKLPHVLHVDRASRKLFATSYFGTSGSIFITPLASIAAIRRLIVNVEHFALTTEVYVPVTSRGLQLSMQIRIGEDDEFASIRSQALICGLEDAVQLIEAHAKAYEKASAEQGEAGTGVVEKIENEDGGAEGVGGGL